MQPYHRRSFFTQVTAAAALPMLPSFLKTDQDFSWIDDYKKKVKLTTSSRARYDYSTSPDLALVEDEQFWYQVKNMYSSSPGLLNLNNGGVSPQPKIVQDAFERYNRLCNEAPSYYMWRILDQGREPLRQRLAALAGTSAEELAVVRNA